MEEVRILLVEQSSALRKIISAYLTQFGWSISECAGVPDARLQIAAARPNVVLLALDCGPDVLPFVQEIDQQGVDGFVTSESSRVQDRIACFEHGAADFMTKPLDLRELALRLKRLWRGRARGGLPANMDMPCGNASLDIASRGLRRRGAKPVALTPSEFRLLFLLLRNDGRIVDRAVIARDVLGHSERHASRSVDVMVSKLRRKLASAESGCFVRNVRSEGYMLATEERISTRVAATIEAGRGRPALESQRS